MDSIVLGANLVRSICSVRDLLCALFHITSRSSVLRNQSNRRHVNIIYFVGLLFVRYWSHSAEEGWNPSATKKVGEKRNVVQSP